ncbi:MAG: hypothetical protein TU36_000985 [Vulcanisaeta sp. AZ3]
MDTYVIGTFINNCEIKWRTIEGFAEAVEHLRVMTNVYVENNIIRASPEVCDEVNKFLQKPLRLLTLLNIIDWISLIRGLYDFNGELMDPEPSLDIPNLVLSIRVPSKGFGLVVRIVLKMLGIDSNIFPSNDGVYIVIHNRDSIARFINTIKPYLNPEENFVLRDKWAKHYANHGNPIILIPTQEG